MVKMKISSAKTITSVSSTHLMHGSSYHDHLKSLSNPYLCVLCKESISLPKFVSLTWMRGDQDYELELCDPSSPSHQVNQSLLLDFVPFNHVLELSKPSYKVPNVWSNPRLHNTSMSYRQPVHIASMHGENHELGFGD